ncbi:MAG: hypothetical protein L0G25_00030 [Psychrobacter sp.]|nr:hypothetical protein [Psychrobacter sp.]
MLIAATSGLLSCEQQPKSMFEQQAEIKSDNELATDTDDTITVAPVNTKGIEPIADSGVINDLEDQQVMAIRTEKQQAIARQPNCDANERICQYFELNVLEFIPKQPWLTSIMWKTIAQVLAPEAPLASQDQIAKNTILRLLKQVEYGDNETDTLPIYERIDTELVLNPIYNNSNSQSDIATIATGYLLVRSTEEPDNSAQRLSYVMLDVEKKLQLTIEDVLLPEANKNQLLTSLQKAKKEWLISQSVAKNQLDDRPLQLSKQWYLDDQGLHMVYQSGELINANTTAVDLIVPYNLLEGLIKPYYVVQKAE